MQVFEHYQLLERYIGWTDEDARRVQSLGPLLTAYFDSLVDDFYAEIERHPEAARVIVGGQQQIDRLKRTLRGWLNELFSGQYDADYVARRWDVGKRHADIGLDQLYTNAALLRLRRGLLAALGEAWKGNLSEQLQCHESLNTLLDLNRAIIEHAYHTEYERRQRTAERLAMIGQVAGSIVQELRGPLDSTKDAITFLRQTPQSTPEFQSVQLDRIDRQVCLAEGVVAALNDFVRLPLENFQPVEIIECLKGALDADSIPESIRVQWNLPVARLSVLGDPAQLRVVLSGLIRATQDATHKGGSLHLSAVPDGDAVYITIQHFGVCKCKASQPVADGAINSERPSVSLGLSILHDIVLRHRGEVTITTEDARTTATLRLPTHDQCLG